MVNLDILREPFKFVKIVTVDNVTRAAIDAPFLSVEYRLHELNRLLDIWKTFSIRETTTYIIIRAANGQEVYVTVDQGTITYSDQMSNYMLMFVLASN